MGDRESAGEHHLRTTWRRSERAKGVMDEKSGINGRHLRTAKTTLTLSGTSLCI
jgi:hypothetical protein